MPKPERIPSAAPKQEYTPLVKKERGGDTLNRSEQFVTKAEAYKGVAGRLREINEELRDLSASGLQGTNRERESTLNDEAKKLIGALDRMEQGVTEEQAREAYHSGAQVMVENPFYEDTSEAEAFEESFVGKDFSKQERPMSPSQLKKRYEELKARNEKITELTRKLEGMEQAVIAAISLMQNPSMLMREDLKKKQSEALRKLTGDYSDIESEMANTVFVERVHRKHVQRSGFPDMLNTISESLEQLGKEKTVLLGELSTTVDRLNKFGKQKEVVAKKQEDSKRRAEKQKAEVDAFEESFLNPKKEKSDAERLEEAMLGADFPKDTETTVEEVPPAKSGTRHRKPTKKAA